MGSVFSSSASASLPSSSSSSSSSLPCSSSSSVPSWKYDVFISFRGEDTRNSFTSFLHDALRREKIETYIDEEDLGRGDEISLALMRAIEESMISVVIFSENYANSSWCLDELVHILKCKREYERLVVPVFYKVDPSDIRNQRGSYAIAFAKRKKCFEHKLDSWRVALREAANLAGWGLQDTSGKESELVKEIVKDIVKKLNDMSPSYDHEYLKGRLFGIDQHIKKIELLLDIGTQENRILGIWGMGGIGKTTLARVLFDKFSHLFEVRCFLDNVREESKNHYGLRVLKVKLFSKLLGREVHDPDNTFERNRVRRKKVLIVLDDVSHEAQLRVLGGDRGDSFGFGSRILVTTRDKQALTHQVNDVYKLDGLNRDDALGLFHRHAFKETSPTPDFNELSKEVVDYAGGNPLALEISGSFFRGKEIEDWRSLLERLKGSSIEDEGSIQKILKISYDGLRKDEKDAFLDAACFLRGMMHISFAKIFLDVTIIKDLVDKSLIIDDGVRIYMHDLVKEMGRKVVHESSSEDRGKLSRIWNNEDAFLVLHQNIGTEKIEAIFLDHFREDRSETKWDLPRDVFKKMYNLRVLKFGGNKVHLPEGLEFLPNKLKCLQWDYYPLKSLPKNFNPCNLAVLHMSSSNELEQLWDGVKDLHNLREIRLSFCKNLTQLPDLSRASKLECVNLTECRSLKKFPQLPKTIKVFLLLYVGIEEVCSSLFDSFSSLSVLQILECKRLVSFPAKIYLKSLKQMHLSGCSKLEIFPKIEEPMENLRTFKLGSTPIKELPRSIENLVNLQELTLYDCEELQLLPNTICKLYHLEVLSIVNCSKLEIFPEIEEPMKNLLKLELERITIKELPRSIENLVNMRKLFLNDCKELRILPNTICKLYHLAEFSFVNCSKIPPSVGFLDAIGCISLEEVLEQHWFDQCFANFSVSAEQYKFVVLGCVAFEMCWAGHKIPRWFRYQKKESSLSMEFCLNSFEIKFLGIAFCAVVDFSAPIHSEKYKLCCQAHCDGAPDGVLFTWIYQYWARGLELHGDHVFIRCDKSCREGLVKKLKEYKANQNGGCTSISVNFKFSFEVDNDPSKKLNLEVKECGVYLLYAKDAETFGIKIGENCVDVDDDDDDVINAEKL